MERYEDTIQETLFTFDAFEMVRDLFPYMSGPVYNALMRILEIRKRRDQPNPPDLFSAIQGIRIS